jgi:hypothetical protein
MFAVFQQMKVLHLFLAAALFLEGMGVAFANPQNEGGSIDNVHFEVAADLVRIQYDLNAPLDQVHAVRVTLRRDSDSTFAYKPVNITGDVGTIVFPGQKRRIIWEFTKEFPEGLKGSDYYFLLEAEGLEPESSNLWWWVGGGAAAVTGVVLVLVLSNKGSTPGPTPTPTGFPTPPTRPE